MNKVHWSILFNGMERYGSACFFLVSTAILSRLLTPPEFGIYTVVTALTALGTSCFQEFGGAGYLIQKPALSEQDVKTAFTMTLCIAICFAGAFYGTRDAVAWLFSLQPLTQGIAISSVNFLLVPFSGTLSALLRREMAFGVLARCGLASNFVTAAAAVAFTASGYSFMGPLLGAVMGHAALVGMLIARSRQFRFFYPSLRGYRDVLGFGAYSSAVALINIFYQWSPQLILARILDLTAVGLYGRAVTATQLFDKIFLGVLSPVIMPAISEQTRAGADLRRLYLDAVRLLTAVQWPFLIFMTLMAEPIVRLWFGPGWLEIVPLVRMICLASLSLFAACLTYPVLVAIGRVRDSLLSSLISVPPSLLVIFIASFFGVQAVAASAFLTLPFQAGVALYFIGRHLKVSWVDLIRATLKSGIVTACSATGAMVTVASHGFTFTIPPFGLLGAGVASACGWYVGLLITKHPLLAQFHIVVTGITISASRMIRAHRHRPENIS
jgi:O-antigen/teichoic acid export membrane protein